MRSLTMLGMLSSFVAISSAVFMAVLFTVDFTGFSSAPFLLKALTMISRPALSHHKPYFAVEDIPELGGKAVVVTGGNSGVGFESARLMAAKGAKVVITCRSMKRCGDAVSKMRLAHPSARLDVVPLLLDLCSLSSVRSFVEAYRGLGLKQLDVLMLNAGKNSGEHFFCEEKYESMVFSHHVAHFYLTQLLYPDLAAAAKNTGDARVVLLSSAAIHMSFPKGIDYDAITDKSKYNSHKNYGMSKLANVLMGREMQKYAVPGLSVAMIHPGFVITNFFENLSAGPLMSKLPDWLVYSFGLNSVEGALTQLRAAVDPKIGKKEFEDAFLIPVGRLCPWEHCGNVHSENATLAAEFWDWTLQTIQSINGGNLDFEDLRKTL